MIRLRGSIKRQGRKMLALGVIALLSLVLAWEHSAPGEHGMSGDEMGAAISICLAVVEGGTAFVLLALGFAELTRRRRISFAPARAPSRPAVGPRPLGRAPPLVGPAALQVFLR